MSRAKNELLDELHGAQAENLLSEMRQYKQSGDPIPPALFAQINKFLKDNGVDRAITPGDPTSLLDEETTPDFQDSNIVEGKF